MTSQFIISGYLKDNIKITACKNGKLAVFFDLMCLDLTTDKRRQQSLTLFNDELGKKLFETSTKGDYIVALCSAQSFPKLFKGIKWVEQTLVVENFEVILTKRGE